MSLFRLKTNESELASANKGVTNTEWRQFAPSRDVTLGNFHNGAIHIRFDIGGDTWWTPKDSYIRARLIIEESRAGGANNYDMVRNQTDVSLNMFVMSCLFQSMEFRINDKVVSRMSENVAQIEALEHRMSKSQAWMESVGLNVLNASCDHVLRKGRTTVGAGTCSPFVGRSAPDIDSPFPAFGAIGNVTFVAAAAGPPYVPSHMHIANPGFQHELRYWFKEGDRVYIDTGAGADMQNTVLSIDEQNVYFTNDLGAARAAAGPAGFVDQIRVGTTYAPTINTEGTRHIEIVWKPNLSIFKIPHALPLGKYELVLNPFPSPIYKYRALYTPKHQALVINPTHRAVAVNPGEINFAVENMFLYCATVRSSPVLDYTYLLDLEETTCQIENIPQGQGNSLEQKQFTVSPATYALTLAFQDNRCGNAAPTDCRFAATHFKAGDTEEESRLERMFINYAGMNKPQPDADPQSSYVVSNQEEATEFTMQRYIDNIIQTRGYFNDGGTESWGEWKKRGPYYYFNWPRDGTDRSQRVMVNYKFAAPFSQVTRLLLFSHFRKVAKVRIENGNVTDVQVNEY